MDPSLLEILVCPECKGPLKQQDNRFCCRRCRLAYPVTDKGAPILIVDEADNYHPDKDPETTNK